MTLKLKASEAEAEAERFRTRASAYLEMEEQLSKLQAEMAKKEDDIIRLKDQGIKAVHKNVGESAGALQDKMIQGLQQADSNTIQAVVRPCS